MTTPLTRFTLAADTLPERLRPRAAGPRFSLPGAQELAAFGDLLGGDAPSPGLSAPPETPGLAAQEEGDAVPFALPALIPEDVGTGAALRCTLRFERTGGTRAHLELPLLVGSGEVLLGGERIACFCNQPLTLELSDALRRRRQQILELRFDDARPAGVCGTPMLRTGQDAWLKELTLLPDAREQTVTLRVRILAQTGGDYLLRVWPCPPSGAQAVSAPPDARETALSLHAGEMRELFLTLAMPGETFAPGQPYAAPCLRAELLRRLPPLANARKRRFPLLRGPSAPPAPRRACTRCDAMTLLVGYNGSAPGFFVPLARGEVFSPPDALAKRLRELGVRCIALPVPGPDLLYRELTRAGIAALHPMLLQKERERLARFPCVCRAPASAWAEREAPALCAWRLCAMVGMRRDVPKGTAPAELLEDAAGFPVDADAPGTQAVLQWLRAVETRLRAEAARQGHLTGALCAADALQSPDAAEALRTALAPTHISALPLRGAWWTCSHFSATIHAFLADIPSAFPKDAPLRVLALLEDEAGEPLARAEFSCPPDGGELGLLEAALPDAACALTLITRLLSGDAVLEQSTMPVYVGARGPLEAAFR